MQCPRHRSATAHGRHCAACLLEQALLAPEDTAARPTDQFTVHVPLGETARTSVFLVHGGDQARVLRLKRWHAPAPAAFLVRFERLKADLEAWSHPSVPVPLRAWVDPRGRPSVLSEFRQGLPILDCLRAGRLGAATALWLLTQLEAAAAAGHQRGLVHGSIGPGNVLVNGSGPSAHLLDFGLAGLVCSPGEAIPSAAADEAGLAALDQRIRALGDPAGFPL